MTVPAISSISPTYGDLSSTIIVIGTGFKNATTATVGSIEADFTVISDTLCHVQAPSNAYGFVTITNPDGTATSALSFMTIQPPVVTSFSPETGQAGVTGVQVLGIGMASCLADFPGSGVTVNGTPLDSGYATGEFGISFRIPKSATTGMIVITNPAGSTFCGPLIIPYNYATQAFARAFNDAGLGAGDDVWTMERQSGAKPQTVLQEFEVVDDDEAPHFNLYPIQIAIYHPNRHETWRRCHEAYTYYRQFRGKSSINPGYTFYNWHSEQVRCQFSGVVDSIEITGALLFKAMLNITLVTLYRTDSELFV